MRLTARIPETEWERHKEAIFDSYMNRDCTLDEVQFELSAGHQFTATKAQYITRLKRWGFSKNRKQDDWRSLDASLRKRKLDSSGAVILDGAQRIPAQKVARQIARYRPSQWMRDVIAIRARTPEGISIRSAALALSPRTQCVVKLPWQDFCRRSRTFSLLSGTRIGNNLTRAGQFCTFTDIVLPQHQRTYEKGLNEIDLCPDSTVSRIESMNQISPHNAPAILSMIGSTPRALRELPRLIPMLAAWTKDYVLGSLDEYSPISALSLMDSDDPEIAVRAYSGYMAFLISNNLLRGYSLDGGIVDLTLPAMRSLTLLQDERLGSKVLQDICRANNPTQHALLVHLAHSAIESGSDKVVTALIEQGTITVESPTNGVTSRTLLGRAIECENIAMVRFLCNKGAIVQPKNVDKHNSCCHSRGLDLDYASPLELAAKLLHRPDQMLSVLLEAGAVPDSCHVLRDAIRNLASLDTIRLLLLKGADPDRCVFDKYSRMGVMPLSIAASRGDWDLVEMLLKSRADPNGPLNAGLFLSLIASFESRHSFRSPPRFATTDESSDDDQYGKHFQDYFRSPVLLATENGSYETVLCLLEYGADPNISAYDLYVEGKGPWIWSTPPSQYAEIMCLYAYPLQAAVACEDLAVAKLLRQHGACLDVRWGTSLVAIAAFHSRFETVAWLLKEGANIDATTDCGIAGFSALEGAIYTRNLDMVKILHQAGANIDLLSEREFGRTPLQAAAEIGDTLIFDLLLEAGADIHSPCAPMQGISVLEGLVIHGFHDEANKLLQQNVPPGRQDGSRTSPLSAAVLTGNLNTIDLLLEASADMEELASVTPQLINSVPCLNEYGTSIYRGIQEEFSPLHLAVLAQDISVLKRLLEMGANINARSRLAGITPLHLAVFVKSYAMAECLIENGADVNMTGLFVVKYDHREVISKSSPLISAVVSQAVDLVRLLLTHKAVVNVRAEVIDYENKGPPRLGFTALETACHKLRDATIIELLLQYGADVSQCQPIVALLASSSQACSDRSVLSILTLLISKGADVDQEHDYLERSPLAVAVGHSLDAVKQLVEAGANITASLQVMSRVERQSWWRVKDQRWPLSLILDATACREACEIWEYLLSKDLPLEGCVSVLADMLEYAATRGLLRLARLLLDHRAPVTVNAVELAAVMGRLDMVKLLLDNYDGPLPMREVIEIASESAQEHNEWFVLELLRDYQTPERVSDEAAPDIFDEPAMQRERLRGPETGALEMASVPANAYRAIDQMAGNQGFLMPSTTILEPAMPKGLIADVSFTDAADFTVADIIELQDD